MKVAPICTGHILETTGDKKRTYEYHGKHEDNMTTNPVEELPASSSDDDEDGEDEIVTINVGGTRHQVLRSTLAAKPKTKLALLNKSSKHYKHKTGEYFFDRHPAVFTSILNFYRVGELHLPTDVCKVTIQKELLYWQICEDVIEDCCWLSYNALWDQMHTLAQFDKKQRIRRKTVPSSRKHTWWQRWQPMIWEFIDDPYYNVGSQILAWVSLAFVMVSIFTFCAETHPAFMVNMTVVDYANTYGLSVEDILSNPKYWNKLSSLLKITQNPTQDPQTPDPEYLPDAIVCNETGTDRRRRSAANPNKDEKHHRLNMIHWMKAKLQRFKRDKDKDLAATGSSITTESTTAEEDKQGQDMTFPWDIPNPILTGIDYACYFFFTIELLTRFVFCESKRHFFYSFFNIIDLLAVLPFYIELIINEIYAHERYQKSLIDVLLFVRIIRIFRVFRLIRHHRGLQVLVFTIKASVKEIMLLLLFLGIGMVIFSSLVYYADQDSRNFQSIPHAFWWAVITMTTVGYGDIVPNTTWGFLVGSICAISGVLVIAFTVPVIVNNFMLIYQYVQFKRDGVHALHKSAVTDPNRWKPSNRKLNKIMFMEKDELDQRKCKKGNGVHQTNV